MIVAINNYELETENIVKYYPCDILGNYQEQSKYTLIEYYMKNFENTEQTYTHDQMTQDLIDKIIVNVGLAQEIKEIQNDRATN